MKISAPSNDGLRAFTLLIATKKSLKKTKMNTRLHFHNSAYMATMFNSKIQRTNSCQSPVLFIQYGSTINVCSLYLQLLWGEILHCVPSAYTLYLQFCIYCVCLSRVLLVLPLFVYLIC